jgi:hypothetical protein
MKSKPKHISYDVMLNGRYIHTLHFPLRMADDFVDGDYVVSIETLQKYTEKKLPTLTNQPYNIALYDRK